MARIKVGQKGAQTTLESKDIAMVGDTYLLMNQRKESDPSFVLTGMTAKDFVSALTKVDKSAAFVSTEHGSNGMFLNIDHMKQVRDHEVVMDFGKSTAAPTVHTSLTKAEMEQKMNQVSDLVLSAEVNAPKQSSISRTLSGMRAKTLEAPAPDVGGAPIYKLPMTPENIHQGMQLIQDQKGRPFAETKQALDSKGFNWSMDDQAAYMRGAGVQKLHPQKDLPSGNLSMGVFMITNARKDPVNYAYCQDYLQGENGGKSPVQQWLDASEKQRGLGKNEKSAVRNRPLPSYTGSEGPADETQYEV